MIRPATAADLPVVEAITHDAYAEMTDLLGGPPLPVTDDYRARIRDGQVWLLGDPPLALIVLETAVDHIMIFSIAVLPSAHHSGHGRRLLAFAEERAREAGVAELRLYTNARMERNLVVYARAGFVETGCRPNPLRPGWILVDMSRTVTPQSEP